MATQGYGAVAPLHSGTRALEHGSQPLGLDMEVGLRLRAQRAEDASGCQQRGTEPLGEFTKRCASADAARLGDAIEIRRGNQLGVHDEGDGWR